MQGDTTEQVNVPNQGGNPVPKGPLLSSLPYSTHPPMMGSWSGPLASQTQPRHSWSRINSLILALDECSLQPRGIEPTAVQLLPEISKLHVLHVNSIQPFLSSRLLTELTARAETDGNLCACGVGDTCVGDV